MDRSGEAAAGLTRAILLYPSSPTRDCRLSCWSNTASYFESWSPSPASATTVLLLNWASGVPVL